MVTCVVRGNSCANLPPRPRTGRVLDYEDDDEEEDEFGCGFVKLGRVRYGS